MTDNQQKNTNQNSEKVTKELAEAIEQAEANLAGWKRTAADFENYKKRKEAESKELIEFAKEVTITRLLPTLDTLETALRHMPEYQKADKLARDERADKYPYGTQVGTLQTSVDKSAHDERADKSARYSDGVASPFMGNKSDGVASPFMGNKKDKSALDEDIFAKQYRNWQVGINGILMQLDKLLEELGVKKIEALGKKFDPNLHEAVKEVEGDKDHIVVEELQSGFILNGKVIRPSQVVISKKKL